MSVPHSNRATPTAARHASSIPASTPLPERSTYTLGAARVRVVARQGEQRVVPVLQVGGRWKVRRGRPPPAAQDRRHMDGDADLLPGGEAARIALAPVGAGGAVVVKMGVDVDQHGWKSGLHDGTTPRCPNSSARNG